MKKVTFAMLVITLVMFIGLNFFSDPSIANVVYSDGSRRDAYLNIMTCNKQQYYMVKEIAGDKHNVQFMFDTERKSQEFKYNNETVQNVSNMDIFLYSGNSFEPWVNGFIEDLDKFNISVINISRGIRTIQYEGDTSKNNPYFWTGVDEYKIALYNIKSSIQDKDPKNRQIYEENYENSIKKLDKSIDEIKLVKVDLSKFTFISLDDRLDYFYRSIGIVPIKAKDKTISTIIDERDISIEDVILLKDAQTEADTEGFKVLNLESFNSNKSFNQIILDNLRSLYSVENVGKFRRTNQGA